MLHQNAISRFDHHGSVEWQRQDCWPFPGVCSYHRPGYSPRLRARSFTRQGCQMVLADEVLDLPRHDPGASGGLIADAVQLGTFEGCASNEARILSTARGQARIHHPAERLDTGPAKVIEQRSEEHTSELQ